MTARNIRRLKTPVTTEDAFGTPAAARGSMINVAGATDDDVEGDLLTDDESTCPCSESALYEFIEEAVCMQTRQLRRGIVRDLVE